MLRRPLVTVVALCTAVALFAPASGQAAERDPSTVDTLTGVVSDADAVLARTESVLRDASANSLSRPGPLPQRPEASLLLRDLFVARDGLDGEDRASADSLLARPTDGPGDQFGDGYTVPSKKKCNKAFCVHFVTSTADRAPGNKWVKRTLKTMKQVLKLETKRLGYRKPPRDGRFGGNGKFDIYLKDVGAQGLFGYCAPERTARGSSSVASSYCVLDNDFARSQFRQAPSKALRVTAAHEFFHAVQFGYDFREDKWLLESTATWIEERFADSANDNRRYLPAGQISRPGVPLDRFAASPDLTAYGNWLFWEHVTARFGNKVVRNVFNRAAALRGSPNQSSVPALVSSLRKRGGGFSKVFARYAARNNFPARAYSEGKAYPSPSVAGATTLGKKKQQRAAQGTVRVDHLASQSIRVNPAKSLKGKRWKLQVKVKGPKRSAKPAAVVVLKRKNGKIQERSIRLGRKGGGSARVPFGAGQVATGYVTVANTSPRRNNVKFTVRVKAVRR